MPAMRKLVGIQYLRAVAVIGVVLFHATHNVGLEFRLGEAGVDLFFILSGFIMVAITTVRTRPWTFLSDRLRRIVPLYWIITCVMIAGAMLHLFPNLTLTFWHITSSLLFIPSVSPSNGHVWPVVVPGWTLNYEMFFYVIFSVLLSINRELLRILLLVVIFGLLSAAGSLFHPSAPLPATYFDPITLEFAAGAALGYAWKTDRLLAVSPWAPFLLGCGFYMLAALAPYSTVRPILYGIPAFLVVLGCLLIEKRNAVPLWKLPLFLGDASYSIYLWHSLGISVLAKALHATALPAGAKVLLLFVGGTLVGSAAYRFIEDPINKFLKARRNSRGTPVPAGP
jgi:exopolysaccharide production protein ExoZ